MPHWLLAAEADKIQDLVFRSAHLREVMGGSELLTQFCEQETRQLLAGHTGRSTDEIKEDLLVHDGGSFSIVFRDQDTARRFGLVLAQAYREQLGGALTVAEPVPWSGEVGVFKEANKASRQALVLAKRAGHGAAAVMHLPYGAFCASCGVELAATHESQQGDERPNYLCRFCRAKADPTLRKDFFKRVLRDLVSSFDLTTDTDKAAEGWDPRRYVAYIVADGNGMGRVFDRCSEPDQVRILSTALTQVLYESVRALTKLVMYRTPASKVSEVPVVPLILGGDDVFLRLPAPYALDFARRFCQEYEERMEGVLKEIGLPNRPTISAAVVICKSKYPHTLVHQHGKKLLAQAKRLSKKVALKGQAHSTVQVDLILGSRIVRPEDKPEENRFYPYLGPYWVCPQETEPPKKGLGLPLARLIDQRYALRNLAARRRSQLQKAFDPAHLPQKGEDAKRWQARLEQVIARVARGSENRETELKAALEQLGGSPPRYWYNVSRPGEHVFYGHGMPDLLKLWNYCLDLERDRDAYELDLERDRDAYEPREE